MYVSMLGDELRELCMYGSIYVSMCVQMYVSMSGGEPRSYVCDNYSHECMYVCMYVCVCVWCVIITVMYVCMYVWCVIITVMYVCMYVWCVIITVMYVCMYGV
jgi:hypothetical protein